MSKETSKTEFQRTWRLIDAKGQILGRLATDIAVYLRGKYRPSFRPHENLGDVVVVINTDHLKFSGSKEKTKMYRHHTRWPGGLREKNLEEMMKKDSTEVLRLAVYGMIPRNRLRDKIMPRLKIYKGSEHPHTGAPFVS